MQIEARDRHVSSASGLVFECGELLSRYLAMLKSLLLLGTSRCRDCGSKIKARPNCIGSNFSKFLI